jgi:hypothetical protein
LFNHPLSRFAGSPPRRRIKEKAQLGCALKCAIYKISYWGKLPPSQPSPTGEGAKTFPPWGKMKGGNNQKEISYILLPK